MKYNIPQRVCFELRQLAKKHGIEKIILFGSRARGSFYEKSDIDIAVSGGNTAEFSLDADEAVHTLLMIPKYGYLCIKKEMLPFTNITMKI